jgi:sugar-specific transcriptional regulator TrmB
MMDLSAAGLTPTEAKCYTALLERKEWKPAELAKYVNETRTNCYKILDNLVGYELAERFDKAKKLHYRAANPSQLLELARQQRRAREQAEATLELQAQQLLTTYYASQEQPGVQYFQGKEEISHIFDKIAHASEPVVFVHTLAGIDFYGFDAMHKLRMKAVKNNTPRHALTPDDTGAPHNYAETDKQVLLERTWLQKDDYTAPVEWGAFDDKLYIISYGEEALGLLIESPQIAASFKQLFSLLRRGQTLLPHYDTLPTAARATARVAD